MSESAEIIFTPLSQANLQYKRLDIQEFLELIDEREIDEEPVLYRIEKGKNVYDININNVRYRVFKNDLHCACCGIQAVRAYLDLDVQSTKKAGFKKYHVNFYSETFDPKYNRVYLTLMTKDKIDIASDNETAFNFQTLCFNCSCMKMNTQLDLSAEQMKQLLFPAYRAYRSTISLNKAKEYLEPYRNKIVKHFRRIEHITEAFDKIAKDDPRVPDMQAKVRESQQEIDCLLPACDNLELQSQITGEFQPSVFAHAVKKFYEQEGITE